MSTKTLSTSTLSLKFMQNAHRAKNLAEVQLDKADVKDDGEWEVAKEIRDAWGPETTQSVTYEASYIPFLFTSSKEGDASPSINLKGRRTFKRGREVAEEAEATSAPATPVTEAKPSTSKLHGKARQISSLNGRTSGADSKKSSKGASSTKSARQAIHDNSGVGADLRTQRKGGVKIESDDDNRTETNVPPPNVFLKPAGVDEPAQSSKSALSSSLASREAQNPSQRNSKGSKRDRDETAAAAASVEGESSSKKRKKKKKIAADE
ncbi:hypothetical protein R3P38DRAFT_2847823 [Favolaschia claudopus]|uniref:Uncharacterized protein n=1 Tax=Favolaschia claudopus TaxID=2862362 RepID=A0AAW0DWJ8_9AGAR